MYYLMQQLRVVVSEQLNFDANRRPLQLLHDPNLLSPGAAQRVVRCALPFAALYRPLGQVCSVGLGSAKSVVNFRDAYRDFRAGEVRNGSQKMVMGVFTASVVVLTVFRPRTGVIVALSQQMAARLVECARHSHQGRKRETAAELSHLMRDLVYLASILSPRSDLILLSLLVQAAAEAWAAGDDWRHGRYLEMIAHLVLAAIRVHAAVPHLEPTRREWFGRDLSQAEFEGLLAELERADHDPDNPVDLQKWLASHNFRDRLVNLRVLEEHRDLSNVLFRNLAIHNCQFGRADLTGSVFDRTRIHHSDFSEARLRDALFVRSIIRDSLLHETVFINSRMQDVRVKNCDLFRAIFAESSLERVNFDRSRLMEANFFGTTATGSKLNECDLTDTLLFDTKRDFDIQGGKPHEMTKPVIGILWDFDYPGYYAKMQVAALRQFNATVALFSYEPDRIDTMQLREEMERGLRGLAGNPGRAPSLPQALLQEAPEGSQLHQTRQIVSEMVRHCHGFILPGGWDIEPELYGEEQASHLAFYRDYRRSMIEAAVYGAAREEKIPLWGICRGSQVIGINAGSKLVQHVDGHVGVLHRLKPAVDDSPTVLDKIKALTGGDELLAASLHHQAVANTPAGFTALLEHRGVIKLMLSDDGLVIGSQVHPEYFVSWDQLPDEGMPVVLDPKKLSAGDVAGDWRLLFARMRDEELREPFNAEKYAPMQERNRNIFAYFMNLASRTWESIHHGTNKTATATVAAVA